MRIQIDSVDGEAPEELKEGVLYWHIPTGNIVLPTGASMLQTDGSVVKQAIGFDNRKGVVFPNWRLVEPFNYRVYNGVLKLSNDRRKT